MSLARIPGHVTLFDDDARTDARNLDGVKSEVFKETIGAMNYAACRYRPIYNFWGINGASFKNKDPIVRAAWLNGSPGCPGLGAQFLAVPSDDDTGTTRHITYAVSSGLAAANGDLSGFAYTPRSTATGEAYPNNAAPIGGMTEHVSYADDYLYELKVGALDSHGPGLYSGAIFERMNFDPRYIKPTIGDGTTPERHQAMPTDWIGPGMPIIGTEDTTETVGDIRSLSQMRDFFRRTYKAKRFQFSWGRSDPSTNSIAISSGSSNQYRYIFDQTIGQGGDSPSATGPGINIPVRYTASGRNSTVRIYVNVYACMSGSTNTATLGFYNLSDSTTMTGPTALTNGPTISGSSMTWYPGLGAVFDPDTHPYFLANADSALVFDHVLLCAKRNGTTDTIKFGAVQMFAYHAG